MRGIVVVPAFNEGPVIKNVIRKIPGKIGSHKLDVVVVNDGSSDGTATETLKTRAVLLTHPLNRGLGAALGTGFEHARQAGYDFLVTLDGDGQHDPAEIEKLIDPIIKDRADFVIGTRYFKKGMPQSRKVITFLASFVTYFFTGVWTTDSQSGFRVFSKRGIEKIRIEVDRMEVSSNFFEQARTHKLRFKEVRIKPIYTEYSLKKGQKFSNSFNIIGRLVYRKLID